MARGVRTDPKKLAEAIRIFHATGDLAGAAASSGVAKSTLHDAIKRGEAEAAKAPRKQRRPRKAAPKKRSPKPPASEPADPADFDPSDPSDPSEPADPADFDPSDPSDPSELLIGSDVDFAELDSLIGELRARMRELPSTSARYTAMAGTVSLCLLRRAKLRPLPGPDPADEEARKRREDGDVRKMLLRYVEEYESQATRDGKCIHCGQELSPELAAKLYGGGSATP